MKKLLRLPLLLALGLSACHSKHEDPAPVACPNPVPPLYPDNWVRPVTPAVAANLQITIFLADSLTGHAFNAKLEALILYYSPTLSEAEIRHGATFSACEGWQAQLPETWSLLYVNVGLGGYPYQPGEIRIGSMYPGFKTVIIWRFTEASPTAPMRYRQRYQYLGLLDNQPGQAFDLTTDQTRAGL